MMAKGKNKATKPAVDVKTKPDGSKKKKIDRKPADETVEKYLYLFPQSMKFAAEANGVPNLPDDLAQALAEDATCCLRSVIQACSKYLKHSRHDRLTYEDVNSVLEMFDQEPIHGYGTTEAPAEFLELNDGGVFVTDDQDVNLIEYALSEMNVAKHPPFALRGKWLYIEDQKDKTEDGVAASVAESTREPNTETESNSKDGEGDYEPKIDKILIKYYANICNSILGYTDLTVIFKDLRKNDKILPIIPSLLNFITITLINLGTDRQIMRLLQTINALADNVKLDFRPFHPTVRIASVLLKIIKFAFVERKRDALGSSNPSERTSATTQFSYSLPVRIKAAQMLAKVARRWRCREDQIIQTMITLIADAALPSRVHVGIITVLKELGPAVLRVSLWNYLDPLLKKLETTVDEKQALEFAIMDAAIVLYRFPHVTLPESPTTDHIHNSLYTYFGDRLCPFWRIEPPAVPPLIPRKAHDPRPPILVKGSWQLPKCINSMYNPMAKRQSIQIAFDLPKIRKKRNPRILFKFAGANPVPEISLKRRRLDSRYSQFIAGKVSEGHVVLIGKFWRPVSPRPKYPAFYCSSLFNYL